ncbi:MAG: hypothetical protein COA96_10985 [SAR86 cluster bacterium]|uniref:Uncharacterized protein n=1 Tax=SAR86 cluster bacterium TaxID=2030880 RepID=A0A2A5AYA8_9GAMM|nr:MAG: hypothetical protein COA96_10985 [SAR86 cluster bacterium]
MSLVNNMLRDLDQRRKDGESSGATVKLTPAVEYHHGSKKNVLPIILAGLIVVVVALGYYWTQMNQTESVQQLDVRLPVLAEQPLSFPEEIAEPVNNSVTESRVEQLAVNELSNTSQEAFTNTRNEEVVSIEPASVNVAQQIDSSAHRQEESISSISSREQPSLLADSSLARSENPESIKNSDAMTNEQLDTIAVQGALRLIANGQTVGAYAKLDDYIANNRFAHQSRETYVKLLISQGEIQQAYGLTEEGLNLAPNHAGFKKVKARILISNGQISDAVELLMTRAPEVSLDLEYHDILATAQLTSRDYQGALISYTGLVRQDQSQGKWWYGFAASQEQLGNTQAASQAYLRAMQLPNLSANLRGRSLERLRVLGQ